MLIVLNQANVNFNVPEKNVNRAYCLVDILSVFDGAKLILTETSLEKHPTLTRGMQNEYDIRDMKPGAGDIKSFAFRIENGKLYSLFLQDPTVNTNIIINLEF